ncbi:membrane-bound hydrogenase subunit beta [Methanolinea mesophila]|uniref:NADH-quinone oxidoreductase subunit C n=1 Tax=Methanolinea mesophila TaxID=547055 RepID=UPI001AEB32FC|nr:NADH-quinone oxidoreductase subunit C [Methanolinea mesophila]MBP1929642.1 membrane-bound hydrogenase subunit beta [Methanolinea mesophila]
MSPDTVLTAEQVPEYFRERFGAGVKETRVTERREGAKRNPNFNIWIDLDRELLKPAILALMELDYPHLAVISGTDLGEEIRMIYHFSIYYGKKHGEYTVSLAVHVPKTDLSIPTISDLIPGAVFTEREKQEFLGIRVVGIPDNRRLFLPEDFPEGVYPWRKDETGVPDSMVKDLYMSQRPTDRPAPPAGEKELCEIEPKAEPAPASSPEQPTEQKEVKE